MTDQIVTALIGNGPYGILAAFMVWQQIGQRKLDKDRIAADIQMATALTLLSAKIDGQTHVR